MMARVRSAVYWVCFVEKGGRLYCREEPFCETKPIVAPIHCGSPSYDHISKLNERKSAWEASAWHFFTQLVFAAPESGLPSLLTALSSQHFLMELVRAAPESALPSLLTALVAQELWAIAEPSNRYHIAIGRGKFLRPIPITMRHSRAGRAAHPNEFRQLQPELSATR